MSNNTTDYGEPWERREWVGMADIYKADGNEIVLNDCHFIEDNTCARIVTCVNACAGLADPAEALRLAREALTEAKHALGVYAPTSLALTLCEESLSALTPNKQ